MVVQQGFGGADVGLDASLTFEQEGALTPGKIAHFDELNTWTQSGTSRMIRKDDWKLVMNHYGNGELYNLKKDPSEVHNLFGEEIQRNSNRTSDPFTGMGVAFAGSAASPAKTLPF